MKTTLRRYPVKVVTRAGGVAMRILRMEGEATVEEGGARRGGQRPDR